MKSAVILLAAGQGSRFGRRRPKQFLPLSGEPLFLKAFRIFARHPTICEIVIVGALSHLNKMKKIVSRIRTSKKVSLVAGGRFRGESVKKGFQSLKNPVSVVLVHDAARPLITHDLIRRVERASLRTGAALAAWPLPDTLKLSNFGSIVRRTIPRKNLYVAQTPQGFQWKIAKRCLTFPQKSATDDVELAERKGLPVQLVPGGATNIKVTYPTDLEICRSLIKSKGQHRS